MAFTLESFYNANLAVGATRLDAVISVTADAAATGSSLKKVFGYMVDRSGSMGENRGQKMQSAKLALRQQINMLGPDDWFFIIAYDAEAQVLVPLSQVTPESRARAQDLVQRISPDGGTVMSRALMEAKAQFEKAGPCIAYAQFVTDGQNDPSDKGRIEYAVNACKGSFQCDAWGIGLDWNAGQLRAIANPLLGTADAVPDPERLDAVFKAALAKAMSRGVADVRLRLQTPGTCRIVSIKQQLPEIVDLTPMVRKVDERNVEVPLGSWGAETRDYYLVATLEPQGAGEEMMAFRPKVVCSDQGAETVVDGGRVIVTWTEDEALSTRISDQVAHYTGQQELSDSIKEGLEAKNRGDLDQATVLFGRAVKLAAQSGNDEITERLKKVVDIVDVGEGTVRLKGGNTKAADLELDMGGTRTVRRRPVAATH
jgi:hypothetical protein